jgi:tRNA dimethylallyltransferase
VKILTITGPTAAGKTEIAIRIARKLSGEIISADSRQIYKYLEIGTATPTPRQRNQVVFHLIDFIHPDEDYSCGQFARDAEKKIEEIIGRSRAPIICGGTGLYIKALFHPLHALPASDPAIKTKLRDSLKKNGVLYLYKRLLSIDPEWAEQITPRDKQRIMRGLEVYETTGKPLSKLLKTKRKKARYAPYYIGLKIPRSELYQRIEQRFDNMIERGLVKEVESLLKRGVDPASNAMRTIGYHEIVQYLHKTLSFEQAVAKAKQRTKNFAKRQMTWFNKIPGIQWFDPKDPDLVPYFIDQWKALVSADKK